MNTKDNYSITILNEGVIIDTFLLYQFIRRLATPFEKWKAFDLGIIDKDGKVLKPRKTLKTKEEKDAFGLFDILVLNLKKLLGKLPFGKSRLASFGAALFLIKEHKNPRIVDSEYFLETFLDFMDDFDLDIEYRKEVASLFEELNEDGHIESYIMLLNEESDPIDQKKAKEIGDKLKVDWKEIDIEEFRKGLEIEQEHDSVTKGDLLLIGKIALDHLKELPDYYTKLATIDPHHEEAPTNNIGSGHIKGTGLTPGDEPKIDNRKKKKRKKFTSFVRR